MQLIYLTEDDLRRIIREENNALSTNVIPLKETPERLSTQKEICTFLGITEPTLIAWRKKGKVPFKRLGSSVRYNINDVTEALEGNKRKGAKS
jgi:excisionase family DNA binding protein